MSTKDLQTYYNTRCRFKLKSGKEVFGVIWEVETANGKNLFFTSLSNAQFVIKAKSDVELASKIGNPLAIEDIILAEKLVS